MKIKTYKYIIIYAIVILLVIYIGKNIDSLSFYIKNFSNIIFIEKIKKSNDIKLKNDEIVKYIKNLDKNIKDGKINKSEFISTIASINLEKNIEKLEKGINKTDLANLYTINLKLEKAEKIILSKQKYNYDDLYNLGNIYFLRGYFLFINNENGYIENIQKAITNYKSSLDIIPNYKKKDFILNNLNLAKNYLSILYVYDCNKIFLNLIGKNNKILDILKNLIGVFQKQIKYMQKWKKYKDLEKCINSFEQDAVNNIEIIGTNIIFFNKTKKGLINLYKNFQDKEDLCYINKQYLKDKYETSLESSLKYFIKFQDKQKKIQLLFKKGKYSYIKKLCNNKGKLGNNQNKENKKMEKNFNNLKDLLQQQQNQNKQKSKPNNKQPSKQDIEKIEKKNKEIEKNAKDMLKKIQERKTQKNYNPMNYIETLFKDFYGNKKDFIDGKKQESIGK